MNHRARPLLAAHPRWRRILTVLPTALAVMATAMAVPAGGATTPSPGPPVPVLRWTACGDGFFCTRATVPLDYDRPHGATISLALVRLPATDQTHRIGSLLTNPGGPGTSGIDQVIGGARKALPAAVRARFDIVGVDPRGVGASSPIRCFANSAAQERFLAGVPLFPLFPVGRREHVAYMAKMAEFGGVCLRHNATIMRHMSTANAARDLDLLRQALGDAKLTFYGVSYGTYLGNVYANLFPDKVRALVLDSVVDPVAWATGRGDGSIPLFLRESSHRGAHATLEEFLRLCDVAGKSCAFGRGNPEIKYYRLLAQARREPIVVPTPEGPRAVTYAEIVGLTLADLFNPDTWPSLAETLQVLYGASTGTATGATPNRLTALPTPSAGDGYDNRLEALFGVMCTDSDQPHDPFVWPRAAATADRDFAPFGSPWAWNSEGCATWPARDRDRYTGPFTRRTTAPVLLIGTRFDPASPYQNAQVVARELPRARLLTYDGWGHGALGKSACISQHVARYLISGAMPPPGSVCAPDRRPF